MNIIYVSNLISENKMKNILENANEKPLQSIQKFHRLLCQGFAKNDINIKTISVIPMSRKINKKTIWIDKKEVEKGVIYQYIPFINFKGFRQICILIGTILSVIKELFSKKKNKIFICDILDTTVSFTTVLMSKIFRYKCVGIVTDLPCNMAKYSKLSTFLENHCDMYVFLTEQMNKKINKNNKPFIVMEGLVDENMKYKDIDLDEKDSKKICIYAGGLYEKYGVKTLIQAFQNLKIDNAQLHLFGTGDLNDFIEELQDDNIVYHGVVENKEVVEAEKKATLLINPRFTNEEYTKYSFPSKNMEYMVSGTPILTTKLPGMPNEYLPYIYVFDEESQEGFRQKIEEILKKNEQELYEKGKAAKEFVLENKNNKKQAERIYNFIINSK